jgi:hypothetical protein
MCAAITGHAELDCMNNVFAIPASLRVRCQILTGGTVADTHRLSAGFAVVLSAAHVDGWGCGGCRRSGLELLVVGMVEEVLR